MTAVAILIPGIMGSVLKLGDEVIWPGPLCSLWLPFARMTDLLREDLVATDCIRRYALSVQYQSLIDWLAPLGFSETDGTLVVAAYDWRRDNLISAVTLAGHIEDAVARHGNDVEITLLAHSMGGMVARAYLESGAFDGRSGFGRVRRLFMLGTPHRGAAVTLGVVLGHARQLFLRPDQVLQAASDPRYPAAYQLLPPAGEAFAWDGNAEGAFEPIDIYDPATACRLGLVAANLNAARQFHARLDAARRPPQVRYFCFAGTRLPTASHVLLRPRSRDELCPDPIEEEDGGDGTVATWSSSLDGVQRQFVSGAHKTLYQASDLLDTLAALLGKPGLTARLASTIEIAVHDHVVAPGEAVRTVIAFGRDVQNFSGTLIVERAILDPTSGTAIAFDPPLTLAPIAYHGGAGLASMSLRLTAPLQPGAYRVYLNSDTDGAASAHGELIVQQP
ncbi:esterase/lipase family protein [Lichenicoccus sp.]|uniref:esterase/lipase family protein n=1 Tax=Lichenicoccus sp. TaxID=2781899 RepID=UPI003D0E2273